MILKYPLILASNSPRRKALLNDMGFDFTIKTFPVDETFDVDMNPNYAAIYLAEKKAKPFMYNSKDTIILTADTLVIQNELILGKPKDSTDAKRMILSLSDNTHEVITGVCILLNDQLHSYSSKTEVVFDNMNENEIDYYINQCAPFDKAGSYGIQEWIGMACIKEIRGSYYNVVGLPTQLIYRELSNLNLLIF